MRRKSAVAVVAPEAEAAAPPRPAAIVPEDGAVEALRARLASGTAREHVLLEFLEDDLREARAALAGVAAWIATVQGALGDAPDQDRVLSLALGGRPGEGVDLLAGAVASVRRRLAQIAARM